MNWIDAEKELPKENGRYLTCCNGVIDIKNFKTHPIMGGYWNQTRGKEWTIGTMTIVDIITHWMPLPKTFNELEKEKLEYLLKNPTAPL